MSNKPSLKNVIEKNLEITGWKKRTGREIYEAGGVGKWEDLSDQYKKDYDALANIMNGALDLTLNFCEKFDDKMSIQSK